MTEMRSQHNNSLVSGLTRQKPGIFIFAILLVVSICSEAAETPPDTRGNNPNANDPGYSAPTPPARTCIDISELTLPRDAIGVYQQFSDHNCQRFKSGAIDRNMYRDNLYHAARYFRICTFDTELRRSYLQKLRREKQSDSIINVYEKFCGRVVDEDGVKWVTKQEHWKWLSTNLFCKTVGEIVSPAGWRGIQLQRGTESHERLEATTQRLCEQLRSNKIDLNEAIFKLEQEANLYDRQAGSDHARQFLSFAMDYFN